MASSDNSGSVGVPEIDPAISKIKKEIIPTEETFCNKDA